MRERDERAAVELGRELGAAVEHHQEHRHPDRGELDDADAQLGDALERAVQDEVGARERGRGPEEDRVERRQPKSVGLRVPHVVERPALVGDVEHRRDAVLDERAPDRVVIGVRERTAVDERGRDHRELHAVALEPRELRAQPRGVAQRHVRDRMHAAPARRSRPDAHQRFHAVMFAVSAPRSASSVRSHSRPKFGNTTASSMPIAASRSARADASQ